MGYDMLIILTVYCAVAGVVLILAGTVRASAILLLAGFCCLLGATILGALAYEYDDNPDDDHHHDHKEE
ncbi:hypothetical protein [Bifidobacterium biavatii]|nr:hypothetical protein [Bifidobacterium biavatii]